MVSSSGSVVKVFLRRFDVRGEAVSARESVTEEGS